jgi:hypothetical protein
MTETETISGSRKTSDEDRGRLKTSDGWQKASVLASIFSSVVLATVGLILNSSIQRTQIESSNAAAQAQLQFERAKSQDDKQEQQYRLTQELIRDLLSDNARHRALAIALLKRISQPEMYEEVVAILATDDSDSKVRKLAIGALAQSSHSIAGTTLRQIAIDKNRPESERSLARNATQEGIASTRYIFIVRGEDCGFQPDFSETGFRIRGLMGIVTFLNPIEKCRRILVTDYDNRTDVGTISKADLNNRIALIEFDRLHKLPDEGFAIADSSVTTGNATFYGFPFSRGLLANTIELRGLKRVRDIFPAEELVPNREQYSPAADAQVLVFQGGVQVGDQGGPVVIESNHLVGVMCASSRVKEGVAGWIVPFSRITWVKSA